VNVWVIIALIGLITFLLRFSFIWLFGRVEVPDGLKRALRFVPAAVLSALIAPAFFFPPGTLAPAWGNGRLWAGILAAAVAWKTR